VLLLIAGDAVGSFPFDGPPVPVVTEESRRRVERWEQQAPKPPRPLPPRPLPIVQPLPVGQPAVAPARPSTQDTSVVVDLPPVSESKAPAGPNLAGPAASSEKLYEARPERAIPSDQVMDLPPITSVPQGERHVMNAVQQRADECNRRAFGLASRGAFFAAESEFIRAARIIAQALDARNETARHSRSLEAGLTAIDEANDFAAAASGREGQSAVEHLIARHRTPVVKDGGDRDVTAMAAMRQYYTYAQEQLAYALDNDPVGSVSLYGLGKIYAQLPADRNLTIVADAPKAIVAYQAALVVDERNFLAAHELGVMLARCGRLGQHDLAVQARRQAQLSAARGAPAYSRFPGSPQKPVVWVEPAQFARTNRNAELGAPQSIVRGETPPARGEKAPAQKR
jgi:hypothetical protein